MKTNKMKLIFMAAMLALSNCAAATAATTVATATATATSTVNTIPTITAAGTTAGKFYLKAQAGQSILHPIKNQDSIHRVKNNQYWTIAAGYNTSDSTRIELQFEDSKTKFSSDQKSLDLNVVHLNLHTLSMNNISFNIYKDIFNHNEKIKVFLGAGIGCSQINETINYQLLSADYYDPSKPKSYDGRIDSKGRYRLSHNLILGASYNIDPLTTIELSYNYKNYGKTTTRLRARKEHLTAKYKSDTFTFGIRHNI